MSEYKSLLQAAKDGDLGNVDEIKGWPGELLRWHKESQKHTKLFDLRNPLEDIWHEENED